MSFVLTDENYYSREADIHYMSCSQYQSFRECEAAAIAKLRGEWVPAEEPDALFQGRYFHAALESEEAFKQFCEDGFDKIYKTKEVTIQRATKDRPAIKQIEVVGKYAAFEKLDEMLEVVRTDPVMSQVLAWDGVNELFMTGEIGGIPWRMKMDKYCAGRRIVDYKTTADAWKTYYDSNSRQRVSFIEEYEYMMRAAVYAEIERQNGGYNDFADFIILAVSKQDPPDRMALVLTDPNRWALELEKVKENLPHIQRLKDGHENPRRCGQCEYCRKTKRLEKLSYYTDIAPDYRSTIKEYDDYGGQNLLETL